MKILVSAMVLAMVSAAACSSTTTSSPGGGPTAEDDAGTATPDPEIDAGGEGDAGATPAGSCTSAREQLLVPIAKVSQAAVTLVSTTNGVRKMYVDASAGGQAGASRNPRVYVDLSAGARVDVTDETAVTSTAWDLAFKRTVIFTNSGDGGPGEGGAAQSPKAFETFAAADAAAARIRPEAFFDAECNALTDAIGGPLTNFSEWYDYDTATNTPTPKPITWVVRGATGKVFKMRIVSFTANPDGTTNRAATGYYLLEVADL